MLRTPGPVAVEADEAVGHPSGVADHDRSSLRVVLTGFVRTAAASVNGPLLVLCRVFSLRSDDSNSWLRNWSRTVENNFCRRVLSPDSYFQRACQRKAVASTAYLDARSG